LDLSQSLHRFEISIVDINIWIYVKVCIDLETFIVEKQKMKEHTAKNHADIHKGGWIWHIKLDRNTSSEVIYSGHVICK
jgi:hypothetical protein